MSADDDQTSKISAVDMTGYDTPPVVLALEERWEYDGDEEVYLDLETASELVDDLREIVEQAEEGDGR